MEEMLEATVEGEKKWGTLSWSVLFVSFFLRGWTDWGEREMSWKQSAAVSPEVSGTDMVPTEVGEL
jgi:hypothetical protein